MTNHFTDTTVPAPYVAKTKLMFVSDKKYLLLNIIVCMIFRKWEGVVGTGWSWLSIRRGGGHLWVR